MSVSATLLYALLAGLSALLGAAVVLWSRGWTERNSLPLISFSAGVMLTIAFLNLIPEADALHPAPWRWVFFGFLLLYALQRAIMLHPSHEHEHATDRHLSLLSSFGLSLHSLLDGVIIGIGFEAGTAIGLLTTFAIIMHKMPDGITISCILQHDRVGRGRILLISSLVAALTPIGAAVAVLFLQGIAPSALGALIALTAGSFIYLAAADLLPETHKTRHPATPLFFVFGILAVAVIEHFLH